MTRSIEGEVNAEGLHVGVIAALWNQAITDKLLSGAVERCAELGASETTVMRVPGSLELPLACQQLANSGCDAVVAIGVIVKGETDHYDLVANETTRGLGDVALATGVPIGNAVLAVHDISQAVDRAGDGSANKGVEAVDAAVSMAKGLRQLRHA